MARRLWIFAAALLAACSGPKPEAPQPRPVRLATVAYQPAVAVARYSGEVKVRREPALAFQVEGKLAKRLADVGAEVRPGQLLATLDPPDYKINQAGLAAQLEAAQAELAQARKDLQHSANLLAKDLASQAHYDRRRDAERAAQARVEEAKAALALAARKTGYAELKAERAGVITSVDAEAGQVVAAGQAVFHLAQTDEKEVAVNVPENRLEDWRQATAIRITLWANPGVFYQGRVREVSPGADAVLRTFTVKVSILDPDATVRMGMTATVQVERAEPRPAAFLPLAALTEADGRPAVWVFDPASGTVRPRPVALGGYNGDSAKILDGVKEGEKVVTAGVHKLLPGEKVRAMEGGGP